MVRANSAAEVGAAADVVLSCLPSVPALEETVAALMTSARPGQIVVELGSYDATEKARHIAPLAAKGVKFLDGEVSGTPPMVAARKAAVYLAGDEEAARTIDPVIKGFADSSFYFGAFGAATKVKLINNLLVAIHIAATAEAMSLCMKAGIDPADRDQSDFQRERGIKRVQRARPGDGRPQVRATDGHVGHARALHCPGAADGGRTRPGNPDAGSRG